MSEELKISGTIVAIKAVETGTSKAGKEWQKREFAIQTGGQYPKLVAFTLFGEKTSYVDKFAEGSEVEVKFNIESREFGDKYFTNVNAYSITGEATQTTNEQPSGLSIKEQIAERKASEPDAEQDDLPF